MPYKRPLAVQAKVMPTQHLPGVFASMQPVIGAIYDAEYVTQVDGCRLKDFCVIKVNGKKVIMRKDEFVVIGG